MARVILLGLKFILLAVIYLFVARVFFFILTDLARAANRGRVCQDNRPVVSGTELVVTESNDPAVRPGQVIKLGAETRIGRGPHNHLKLSDSFISHDHVQIIFKDEKFFLEDLHSINGTYINGIRVDQPVSLTHGDTIGIGGVTLKFVRWEYEME